MLADRYTPPLWKRVLRAVWRAICRPFRRRRHLGFRTYTHPRINQEAGGRLADLGARRPISKIIEDNSLVEALGVDPDVVNGAKGWSTSSVALGLQRPGTFSPRAQKGPDDRSWEEMMEAYAQKKLAEKRDRERRRLAPKTANDWTPLFSQRQGHLPYSPTGRACEAGHFSCTLPEDWDDEPPGGWNTVERCAYIARFGDWISDEDLERARALRVAEGQ